MQLWPLPRFKPRFLERPAIVHYLHRLCLAQLPLRVVMHLLAYVFIIFYLPTLLAYYEDSDPELAQL